MRSSFFSFARRTARSHRSWLLPVFGLSSFSYWAALEKEDHAVPQHFDFVLVGGGIAAYMAARELREKRKDASVLLIGDELYSPYLRPPLSKNLWRASKEESDELAFPSSDGSLMSVWASGEMSDKGIADVVSKRVVGHVHQVDVKNKRVVLNDETEFSYGKLLLATGSRAVSLAHIDPSVADRVMTLRTLDDWKRLRRIASESGTSISVVGGGYLGSELASSLAENTDCKVPIFNVAPKIVLFTNFCAFFVLQVSLLVNGEGPMDAVLPAFLSSKLGARFRGLGVEVLPKSHVVGLAQAPNGAVAVITEDGSARKSSDYVVLCLGSQPDFSLLARSGLEVPFFILLPCDFLLGYLLQKKVDDRLGGVVANSELQVVSDVFAAGDLVSYYDVNVGVRRRCAHADHASMSGIHAAQNMLGESPSQYEYQPVEFGALVGMEWEGTGLLDSRLDTVSFFDESHGADGLERGVVYYLEEGGIVGVLTVNLPNRMDYAKKLVKFAFPVEEAGIKDTMQMIYLGEKN
jgi:programmed cell death 8 (apoptosis-inducing factor)